MSAPESLEQLKAEMPPKRMPKCVTCKSNQYVSHPANWYWCSRCDRWAASPEDALAEMRAERESVTIESGSLAGRISEVRDRAFGAIGHYLKASGWIISESIHDETFFYYIDPVIKGAHRLDFAFFIQTERDINALYAAREGAK